MARSKKRKTAKGAGVATAEPKKYSFPSKSRCPRCHGTGTRATSTQGDVQYRECKVAVCRRKYTVRGTVI